MSLWTKGLNETETNLVFHPKILKYAWIIQIIKVNNILLGRYKCRVERSTPPENVNVLSIRIKNSHR